ncbi:hypothetical protein COO60DRAFT_26591 [Scenedesmus sp. NREL 46B-D3]|nr:hypothetical protein COO60DRAFT_26591 [Scenedesmus sp. NREL 46B-D3]
MRVLSPPHQTIIVSSIEWMFACDQTALHHSTSPQTHAGNAMTMIPLMPCPDATAQLHRTWPAPTHPHIPVATRTPARVLPVNRCSFYGLRRPPTLASGLAQRGTTLATSCCVNQLNITSDAVAQKSTSTCRLPTTRPRGGSSQMQIRCHGSWMIAWSKTAAWENMCIQAHYTASAPALLLLLSAAGQLGTSSTRSLPGHAGTPCTAWPDMHYPTAAAGC